MEYEERNTVTILELNPSLGRSLAQSVAFADVWPHIYAPMLVLALFPA